MNALTSVLALLSEEDLQDLIFLILQDSQRAHFPNQFGLSISHKLLISQALPDGLTPIAKVFKNL
jgi:hypothetical protein